MEKQQKNNSQTGGFNLEKAIAEYTKAAFHMAKQGGRLTANTPKAETKVVSEPAPPSPKQENQPEIDLSFDEVLHENAENSAGEDLEEVEIPVKDEVKAEENEITAENEAKAEVEEKPEKIEEKPVEIEEKAEKIHKPLKEEAVEEPPPNKPEMLPKPPPKENVQANSEKAEKTENSEKIEKTENPQKDSNPPNFDDYISRRNRSWERGSGSGT